MEKIRQAIGLDVSKDDIKYCIGLVNEAFENEFTQQGTIQNSVTGITSFIKLIKDYISQTIQTQFVMEATGVYHELLAYTLFEKQFNVSIVLPSKSKAFIKSINQRAKTDKIDAKLLCQLGLERQLDKWQPAAPIYANLKALTREREGLQKEKNIITNKLHASSIAHHKAKSSEKRLSQRLKLIEKQIKDINKEIPAVINTDTELKDKVDKISKVNGISLITIATIIAETNGFNLIRNQKQLVGYAGLDVQVNQSGTVNRRGRISKKGNSHIRKALFMPALSAIQTNSLYKIQYQQLNERQAVKMQGVIAIARKLLLLVYALWKNNTDYDPSLNIESRLALNK